MYSFLLAASPAAALYFIAGPPQRGALLVADVAKLPIFVGPVETPPLGPRDKL